MFRSALRCMKVVSPLLRPLLVPQVARLNTTEAITVTRQRDGLFKRLVRKLGVLDYNRSRLKASGFVVYERCADGVDFEAFVEELSLPDTLFSWFLVTELHCWLVMTRAMAEGEEGRVMRNGLVEALWQDVATRIRRLEAPHRSDTMQELSQQFRAALIGYDEGLQGSDTVLAAALWRRLLARRKDVTAQQLETMVAYVRRQTAALDQMPTDDILLKPKIVWLPLKKCT